MSVFAVSSKHSGNMEADIAKAMRRMYIIVHKTTLDMFSRVIKRTPVDSGRTRGNWQYAVGSPPSGVLDELDKSGSGVISGIANDIQGWDPVITAYLANNVPWILKLENGGYGKGEKTTGGFSKQAPRGMVKITVAEFETLLKKAGING